MLDNATPASSKSNFFKGRQMLIWIAIGLGVITAGLLALALTRMSATTTYYVLKQDVAARTLIQPEMLEERITSIGGEPPTALALEEILTGETYSRVALTAGDILSTSTAGELLSLRAGVPSDYVISSFSAQPNDSVGGNVKRGDYVDVYYVSDTDSVSLLFQRILIIDTTTDLNNGGDNAEDTTSATEDTATAPYRVGIPSLYTIALTQEDAAKMALASRGTLYLTLSSEDSVKDGAKEVTIGKSLDDILNGAVGDSGKGTDSSFGGASKDKETDKEVVITDPEEEQPTEAPQEQEDAPEPPTSDEG